MHAYEAHMKEAGRRGRILGERGAVLSNEAIAAVKLRPTGLHCLSP